MLRKTHLKIWAVLFLIVLMGKYSHGYSPKDIIILKLPVRIYSDGIPVTGLVKDDLSNPIFSWPAFSGRLDEE